MALQKQKQINFYRKVNKKYFENIPNLLIGSAIQTNENYIKGIVYKECLWASYKCFSMKYVYNVYNYKIIDSSMRMSINIPHSVFKC